MSKKFVLLFLAVFAVAKGFSYPVEEEVKSSFLSGIEYSNPMDGSVTDTAMREKPNLKDLGVNVNGPCVIAITAVVVSLLVALVSLVIKLMMKLENFTERTYPRKRPLTIPRS